jgi:hypothetical protein
MGLLQDKVLLELEETLKTHAPLFDVNIFWSLKNKFLQDGIHKYSMRNIVPYVNTTYLQYGDCATLMSCN